MTLMGLKKFAVSNRANVQRYEVVNNELYQIFIGGLILKDNHQHCIWMQGENIICCAGGDRKYFGKVDI